jgi:hypothetical protein
VRLSLEDPLPGGVRGGFFIAQRDTEGITVQLSVKLRETPWLKILKTII